MGGATKSRPSMKNSSPFRYFKTPPEVIRLSAILHTVKRITGVEIGYIDLALEQDGKFDNWNLQVRFSQ